MHAILKHIVTAILTAEARLLLRRKQPMIVGVVGSVGKTTTKDAIYAVLKQSVSVRKNEKSFNSDLGIALTILGLRNGWNNPLRWLRNIIDGGIHALFPDDYPDVLVLELGVDRPGDMSRLAKLLKLDVVVLTRLPEVPAHVEFFSSPEKVTEEKLMVLQALKTDGVLIYNNDDEQIRQHVEEVRQPSFGFSRYSSTHFQAISDGVFYDGGFPSGVEFSIKHLDDEATIRLQGVLGVQHTYNVAAALAVAHHFDIPLSAAAEAFESFKPAPGRMRLLDGKNKVRIIDDSYNSSPTAAMHALQALREIKAPKRKVAILGDMLELGKYSSAEHQRLGAQAAETVDLLVCVGLRARKIAAAALEHGFSEKHVLQYDNAPRLAGEIMKLMAAEDVVLVKGSQAVRLELVVRELLADPEKASQLLVRQESVWQQKTA